MATIYDVLNFLSAKLVFAVQDEAYEEAAKYRDRIALVEALDENGEVLDCHYDEDGNWNITTARETIRYNR